ncbi:MAG TPA: translation initiation factor IF-2 [Alphaproteobacteria bacterium]|nr:translation initiation factor IF-2 [Alphaproteobacteria bacterium]
MTESHEGNRKKPLGLSRPGRLELKKTVETGQVRQSFPHGRSKSVTVEVKRKRTFTQDAGGLLHEVKTPAPDLAAAHAEAAAAEAGTAIPHTLTDEEKAARVRALKSAVQADHEARKRYESEEIRRAEEESRRRAEEEERRRVEEEEARRRTEEEARHKSEEEAREEATRVEAKPVATPPQARPSPAARAVPSAKPVPAPISPDALAAEEEEGERAPKRAAGKVRPALAPKRLEPRRRTGKLTITQALDDSEEERVRSLASVRRAREREKLRARQAMGEAALKVVREVVVPEMITVQDLANRMAERGADVVKALMKLGVMATINQVIDADTAELVVAEFGHKIKRVAESDVEIGLEGQEDAPESLVERPPVVTVMGHVDHGKTSLLDALRATDVAAHEAGGITQHIGAYQVVLGSGHRITFLDTPGHEAFTAMRARGAKVTDIVVLVVAADDGVQPQTIEAINHAKAANVPIVVAINKVDKPDANPDRVRNDLLNHGIVLEQFGGEVLGIEVSATKRLNLDKLEEAILLQAELLDLRANPNRPAQGTVIEAKLERGRGPVATVLVERGTLRVGDIFIAGSEWGRVRALLDDRNRPLDTAGPATPVEVLGLNGTPLAGDSFSVVENEVRAREVTEFRQRKLRDVRVARGTRGTVEQMFSKIAAGEAKELPIVVKADVQGSVEAIVNAIQRLTTNEVAVRVLHAGVGGINESDIALAAASQALIVGFNVRANPQAREFARRDGLEIRYYSIIYDVVDDVKKMLSGLLAPTVKENLLGHAEVREVFSISKVGKVAGCMVTDGLIRRSARARLLRDNVVIHDGRLGSLRRFKEDVREVKEGYDCGMSFENYQDVQQGDVIECYEVEEVARALQ